MSCLHLVSFGPTHTASLAQLDALLSHEDGVMLLGDGLALADHFARLGTRCWRWEDSPEGDALAVRLLSQFDKSLSWHN